MKLRLPSKLVAAIMAAASSATFATLATGSAAYGDEAVYTDFSTPFIDSTNNVYYSSQGQFNIESGAETTVILTLNMDKMYSWMNQDGTNHDYIGTTDLISWNYSNAAGTESYTWGINDITNKNASYSGTPALIAASAGAPVGSTLLTYEALNALADSNRLVTLTFNSSASGVSISNGGNVLATTTAVGNSNAAVTTGFHINTNYITSVNLQTASTLDTSTIKLPDDSSVTFVKTREESVGRIVFMGDSITHGVLDGTWRWHMFKTFIDNGIEFDIDGPMSGNHSKPADPDYNQSSPSYAGTAFENVHYAMSSGRTNNMITADTRYTQTVDQLGNNYNVNTGVILIGTNDILSDTGNASGINYDAYKNQFVKLLGGTVTYSANKDVDATWTWTRSESDGWGNMGTILSEMNLEAGDTFYVMSIPTWGVHSNHTNTTDHAAVEAYNGLLEQWVNEYSSTHTGTVKYVDVNKGMVDLTAPSRFFGNKSFFNNGSDGLHPSMQGSLLMAGNLAQAMGIGGRTAGLERSGTSAAGWTKDTTITHDMSHGDSLTLAEGLLNKAGGYTIDFNATFGDGGTPNGDGWLDGNKDSGYGAAQKVTTFSSLTNYLAITVGDGENSGTLKLAEGYITWAGSNGDQVLYCIDNSTNNATLRVAYHPGSVNAGDNVTTGYYVWLNDMLIGQGLEAMHGDNITNGITLGLTSPAGATGSVSNLAWADKAYAPALPSGFMYNAEHAYLPTLLNDKPNRDNTEAAGLGIVFGDTHTSGNAAAGSGNGVVTTTLTNTSSYYGAVNGTGHNGTVSYQVTSSTGMNAFGVVNASVNADTTADTGSAGDVNVVFRGTAEAPITIGTGTYSGQTASFFGTYKGSIAGDLSVEVSHTAMGDIWMGAINADSSTINGSAKLIVNTGSTTGNIYGGSYVNGKILGNSVIEINGGTVNGDIIGAGTNGTIGGYTAITITGGVITGAVNAGTTATGTAAINGTDANGYKSSVTVIGTDARIGGAISAEHVTLKDIENDKEGYTGGMDYYSAAINAGKQLTLDNYTVDRMGSAVTTERVVLKNNSQTTINNLTLTACDITAEAGSTLTLTGTLTLGNTATYSGNIIVEDGITISMSNVDAANVATGGFTNGNSGYFTLGTATLLTPTDASRLHVTDISTYKGEGALANATFAYNESTGVLTATSDVVVRGTYYVNKAITYSPDDAEVYAADRFVIGNGGNLTLATNLKDGVTVAGAESSTTSAITLNSGTTLTKPTQVTSDIASYVVNEGALLDWSGNTTFGEVMVDLSSTVSGNGTVKVAFQNGGHSGYVKTKPSTGDSAFHGTLDLSGNFNLNSLVGNNASDITYFWHDGSFWHNNNVTVANRVELGENFIMRASNTTTFTGQVTGESLRIGWSGNSGRVHFNNALSAIDTVTLYNGASVQYNNVFTGDTIVQAGTTMAGTNSDTNTTSAAAAQQYHGAVYLQGASNSLAKIFYEDGSMFIENGVHVQGYGAIENKWDKHQYLGGIYTDGEADSVLSFSRNNQNNDAKARYVVLTDSGNFHGTINLSHRKDNSYGLIALGADAQQSLAGAVVNFNGTNTIHNTTYTNPTLLAFKKGSSISEQDSGANFIANDLVAANLQDGAVAGLVGNGSVYADGLTIGTRGSSADHSFSGTLNVQSLTKTGEGTQTVTSALNLPGSLSVQGGTLALTGGATLGGSVEIGTSGTLSLSGASTMGTVQNAGVLNLGGTVAVDTDRLWMYEVASSGSGSSYSDGANGYLTDATMYLVKSNGGTVNSTASFTGKEVTNDGAGNLTFTATDTTTYYVNEALTYDNEKMGGAANLHIAKDASLTANGAPTSAKVLVGEGTFNLATVTSKNDIALPAGVTLSDTDWRGIVHLTSGGNRITQFSGAAISTLGNSSSWVELENFVGYSGTSSVDAQTITANLILKGDSALVYYDGYNNQNTFAGDIKGDGVLQHNYRANTLVFQGDISGWTGSLTKNNSGGDNTTVKFEGNATEINTTISKSDNGGFAIQLGNITNGASAYTFNKNVTAATLTPNGHVASISKDAVMTLTDKNANQFRDYLSNHSIVGEGKVVLTGGSNTSADYEVMLANNAATDKDILTHYEITGDVHFNGSGPGNEQNGKAIVTIGAADGSVDAGLKVTRDMRLGNYAHMKVSDNTYLEVVGKLLLGHNADSGSYPGKLTINGGEVTLGSLAIQSTASSNSFVMNGGSLEFTGTGNIVTNAAGTEAVNTSSTTIQFNAGTLKATQSDWTLNHAATVGNVEINSTTGRTLTISSALSDADDVHGTITKTGAGKLTLSGANTFTGDLTIAEGTLEVGYSKALGALNNGHPESRSITVAAGGVLDIHGTGGFDNTDAGTYAVTLAGGKLTNSGNDVSEGSRQLITVLTVNNESTVEVLGNDGSEKKRFGLIGGGYAETSLTLNADLVKTGTGTFMLNRTNITGNGSLVVREGTVQFRTNVAHGTLSSNIVMDGGAVTGVDANSVFLGKDISITSTNSSSSFSSGINTDGHVLTLGGTEALTLSGAISGSGSLVKDGANTMTLSSANSFTGTTTIKHGTLIGANSNALQSSVVTFSDVAEDRVLSFENNGSAINGTIAGLSGTNGAVYANGLTINTAADSNYNYGGTLDITGLTKTGTGTQTLSGTGLSLGTVAVNGGTLALTGTAANMASFDSMAIANGATLDLTSVTGMFVNDAAGSWAKFTDLASKATGEGTVLLPVASNANNTYQIMVSSNGGNATLSTNYVMNHGVSFNNYNNYSNPGDNTGVVIAEGGSLTVNGALKLASGMKMTLNGGSLTANSLTLGHGDASQNYFGSVTMNSGAMTLNGQITAAYGYAGNALNLLSGTFTYNANGNVFANNNSVAVTIGGEDAEHKTTLVADGHSWTLNHDATLGHVTVQTANSGAVTIGTADTTTTLTGLIYNKGDLTLEGTVNVVHDMNTQDAYFTNGSDDHTYGYLNSVTMKVIELSSGSSEHINDVTWKLNGQSADWYGLSEVEYSGGLVLMQGPSGDNSKRWFMNTGAGATFEYTGAESQEMNSFIINAKNDAVLTLNTGDNVGDHLSGPIIVNDTTAAINIAAGTTLAAGKLRTANGGNAVLTGAGTFDLGSVDKRGGLNNPIYLTLPTGVSVGDAAHWTGVVSVSGTINWLEGSSLSDLANENSWVEFKGLTGVWNGGDTIDANIRFTDNGGEAAFMTSGGFGGYTTTFNGKISGTGTYYLTNYNGGIQTFKFNGDASAWTGTLKSNNTNATGNQIEISNAFGATLENEAGNMQVTFKEGAVFSGSLKGSGGTMKVNSDIDEVSLKSVVLNGGNIELSGADYTVNASDNTGGIFTGNGKLTVKNGASLQLNAHMDKNEDWQFEMQAGTNKGVAVEKGASFTIDTKHKNDGAHNNDYALTVKGVDENNAATITAGANRGYNILADNITIANADVELNKRENGGNFANKLENSSFTNTGTTDIALTHTESTLVGVHAETGNVVVKNAGSSKDSLDSIKATGADVTLESLGASTSLNLTELVIGDSKTVTALADTDAHVADRNDDVATIEVKGTLTVGQNANLNANLVMKAGSTYDMSNGNALNLGCALTLEQGENLMLSTEQVNFLTANNYLVLYEGVDSLTLQGTEYVNYTGAITKGLGDVGVDAADYYQTLINQISAETGVKYYMTYSGADNGGIVAIVPEPTTSVLSLLALAGMAARRRRK